MIAEMTSTSESKSCGRLAESAKSRLESKGTVYRALGGVTPGGKLCVAIVGWVDLKKWARFTICERTEDTEPPR
jgi:hypothetical protein